MPKPIQNRPKKDRWDMKRILSTVFVAFISGLLILLFVVGDTSAGCGGGSAAQGVIARIDGRNIYQDHLRDEMNAIQNENRSTGQEMDHEDMLDRALNQYISQHVLLWGAQKAGITLSETTRLEILHTYYQQAQVSPAQFAAAPRSYRREIERRLNDMYLRETFQTDIYTSPNVTTLALRISSEVESIKSTVDLAYIDVRRMAEETTPSNEELQTYFAQAPRTEGTERWRRAKSFEELDRNALDELLLSWKKDNIQISYFTAVQEADRKMKAMEDALSAGKDLNLAAQEAGLPLYTTAPFSWGETPVSAGREFPVVGDFYRQALTLPPGSTSGVLKMPADFPQAIALFRVRSRQTVPGLDMDLLANKAELERLPAAQQETLRQSLRAFMEQRMQSARFAAMQEVYAYLYERANVVKLPRHWPGDGHAH